MPSPEFKKLVRFNGRNYLMQSVYDDSVDFNFDKECDKQNHMTGIPVLDRLPWFDHAVRRSRKVNESFFEDIEDIDDAITQAEEETIVKNVYVVHKENGERMEIELSNDSIKNAVFYLFINFTVIDNSVTEEELSSIDKIVYMSGNRGDLKSFKMDITDIVYKDGSYKLKIGGQGRPVVGSYRSTKGYIQAYFVSKTEVKFAVFYPSITMRQDRCLVEFTYKTFCDILKSDRVTLQQKDADVYYKNIMMKLFDLYRKYGIQMTVCKRMRNLPSDTFRLDYYKGMDLVKNNFSVLYKFGPKTGYDFSALWNCIMKDMENINSEYDNGTVSNFIDDEFYVLIGGHEKYYDSFIKSIWYGTDGNRAINDKQMAKLFFETQNKDYRMKKDPHWLMLIPLSRFVLASPGMLTHLYSE